MEMTADTLVELITEFKTKVEEFRKVEPKVNTTNLVETFDETEHEQYDSMVELLDKLDAMVHGNYNTKIAVAFNEKARKFADDSKARTTYLQSVDSRSVKVEMDEDSTERVAAMQKLRKKITATEMLLQAEGIDLPTSIYKKSEKTGNLLLDLPKTPGGDTESESTATRGRPSKDRTIILGTVGEDGETTWYDNDHVGKTFIQVFGTIRADACNPGLMSAVDKAGIKEVLKNGWTTPVEYAGHKWVAKVRS